MCLLFVLPTQVETYESHLLQCIRVALYTSDTFETIKENIYGQECTCVNHSAKTETCKCVGLILSIC